MNIYELVISYKNSIMVARPIPLRVCSRSGGLTNDKWSFQIRIVV